MNVINIVKTNIGNNSDVAFQNQINTLRRQFQSSNINILLGAGFSYGVAQLLDDIEKRLAIAELNGDNDEVLAIKKEFFEKSILPMADGEKVKFGEKERIRFFNIIKKIVENRQSSILHKIVNVFTTNYDMLIESAFEKSHIEYIDGFSGKLHPTFSTANYGMILSRQTSISSMTSEVVTCNLYKVHGSLNWKCEGTEIHCCDHIGTLNNIQSHLYKDDFDEYYSSLAIINPTKDKLKQTVLNANYYDQLRMYCNELEKNNTILISFGFSFGDEHILQMTERSLKGNPTFSLLIFSFNKTSTEKYNQFFNNYSNVSVFQLIEQSGDGETVIDFTQENLNDLLEEVYNGTK